MLKGLLSQGRNFGLGLCLTVILGCQEAPSEPEQSMTEEEVFEHVVDNYYSWARLSQFKDYYGMIDLVAPQSNFEGATGVCKRTWERGNDLYYEFSSVSVDFSEEQPPKAYIYGNWKRHQVEGSTTETTIQEGGFYSSSLPADGEYYETNWKLNGVNWSFEKNWWR